jgi:hypothetical protein
LLRCVFGALVTHQTENEEKNEFFLEGKQMTTIVIMDGFAVNACANLVLYHLCLFENECISTLI